jgi:hypothetical protein
MSYCRFENTLGDLGDCANNIHKIYTKDLSKREAFEAYRLVELCAEIVDEHYDRIKSEYDSETYEQDFGDDEDDDN